MERCTFSETEIIRRCLGAAFPEGHLGGDQYGNKVLRLDAEVVVKYGVGVTKDEAVNQEKARELLDPKIVRVPKVYSFFEDDSSRGYLVMEFMEGDLKESISEASEIRKLSAILDHFAGIKSSKPGALGEGPSRALIFGQSDPPTFKTIQELEEWFNDRLLEPTSKLTLAGSELILCHLDLFLRNILWAKDQPPCLLDWASAGFFPRILERCSHLIKPQPESWQVVLNIQISTIEKFQCDLITKAWSNNERYSLYGPFPHILNRPLLMPLSSSKNNYYAESYNCNIGRSATVTPPPSPPPYPIDWLEEFWREREQNSGRARE